MVLSRMMIEPPRVCTSSLLGEAYTCLTHQSGLRVLVCPKKMTTACAMLGVGYGSADEPKGMDAPLGVAHFLEHKVFEDEDGEECDRRFSALGAEVNAYTSYDRTVYELSCTEHFREALEALLSLVSRLHVTETSVARERDIIAEEIRMNDDSPFERCYAELLRAMYQKHRVREEICGSETSIAKITPDLLKAHFRAYYVPHNMTLAVCGDVTAEEVMAAVEKQFGEGKKAYALTACPPKQDCFEPIEPFRKRTELRMQTAKPLLSIGVKDSHIPRDLHEMFRKDLCMTILTEMLFSRSGDFYHRLFERGDITSVYSYGSSIGRGYAYYAVSAEGDDPDGVYAAFCDYIEALKRKGLSREDFQRSRRILYADYVTGFDSTEDIASSLLTYAMDGLELFEFLDTVSAITFEEIDAAFRTAFVPEQLALSVVLPLEESRLTEP